MRQENIRNFSIIAHIDHGKSTLADRLLEFTNTVEPRLMKDQVLDDMDLERERGITIKARAVKLIHEGYTLNLIDTPGHVDFAHEVSRSLAACEGAILVIDVSQGVQAQTVATFSVAKEEGLKIIPVINKIDLPGTDTKPVITQIETLFHMSEKECILTSARDGTGVPQIIQAIISRIPPPAGDIAKPLKALIFDSVFDNYKGALVFIRIIEGELTAGTKIKFMANGKTFNTTEIGVFRPKMTPVTTLSAGMVGYIAANIRDISAVRAGDTVTTANSPADSPIAGYKPARPFVFSSFYPAEASTFQDLDSAIKKLRLSDASFTYERENSQSLGFGFRCGFLGMLHMEIVQERLEREYALALITTAPCTVYKIKRNNGVVEEIDNPAGFPAAAEIDEIREFYVKVTIMLKHKYISPVIELCKERRGIYKDMDYIDEQTTSLTFEIPLAEIMTDFFDKMKSLTSGYASADYEHLDWREADLVRLDILLNGESMPSLSSIVHRSKSYARGRKITASVKETMPAQLFPVSIQAAVGHNVIARETKSALRKDVTAKLYGGDVTRKRKLLEKQKKGKRRMKKCGKINISQETFMAVFR